MILLLLQFPVPSHHQKPSDHLGLNYVTERILASVLPRRTSAAIQQQQQQHLAKTIQTDAENNRSSAIESTDDDTPQDIYEEELISMLEQKHGKVSKLFFVLSSIKVNKRNERTKSLMS